MPFARASMGVAGLLLFAWLLSSDRRRFPWKIVIGGMALQWALALIVLRTDVGRGAFELVARVVMAVLHGADEGANFVFGPLAGSHPDVAWPAIAGIKIMTTIIIVATISSIGFHYGVLQRAVGGMAWVMKRSMGVSGVESLAAAANVFFGQTEAPLLVRPYLSKMTQSELMALMTGGFATVAAGTMAVYVDMLSGGDPERSLATARHLLTACLMSAPAAFVMAKIMIPPGCGSPRLRLGLGSVDVEGQGEGAESGDSQSAARISMERETESLVDAATTGASTGMKLAINVLAMLIAFIALIAVIDVGLSTLGRWPPVSPVVAWLGMERLDLNNILGVVFAPVAWLIGVEAGDCRTFGGLQGMAMATNELIAYQSLGEIAGRGGMSDRSILMATYSLCGFANVSSIGIQIGGIGGLAPDRRSDLVRLGPRAMLGGAMGCWMTACIAGTLYG